MPKETVVSVLDARFIEAFKLMNIYLNHFPRHERYGLSQQIRDSMYTAYRYFVESDKRYHKKTSLTNLDIYHEQWRMLVNVAYELGYFKFKDGRKDKRVRPIDRYRAISRKIDEIGRIIGGMIRANMK